MGATVAGTTFRPAPSYTTLWDATAPGEARVRVALSVVNPGDTKKRGDWLGYVMPFPLVVPHSDGSGVIDAVGNGVDDGRIGQRESVFGRSPAARSGRPRSSSLRPSPRC